MLKGRRVIEMFTLIDKSIQLNTLGLVRNFNHSSKSVVPSMFKIPGPLVGIGGALVDKFSVGWLDPDP